MARPRLVIDLDAVVANWRALDALSAAAVETAAVVKADAYGLGAAPVAARSPPPVRAPSSSPPPRRAPPCARRSAPARRSSTSAA